MTRIRCLVVASVVATLALFPSVLSVSVALAQSTPVTVPASSPGTTINVGAELGPWLTAFAGILAAALMAVLTWGLTLLNTKLKLDQNQAALDLESKMRDLLQSALTNAAGQLIAKAGTALNGMTIDLKNPLAVEAVQFVNKAAGDALAHFGIDITTTAGQQAIVAYVAGKIGLLTAATPAVTPTAPATTTAGVTAQTAAKLS